MSTPRKNWLSKQRLLFVLIEILVAAYWIAAALRSPYSFKWLGAVFEILWLPMIIALFAMPLAALGLWAKDRFNIRSVYLYVFIAGAVLAGLVIWE